MDPHQVSRPGGPNPDSYFCFYTLLFLLLFPHPSFPFSSFSSSFSLTFLSSSFYAFFPPPLSSYSSSSFLFSFTSYFPPSLPPSSSFFFLPLFPLFLLLLPFLLPLLLLLLLLLSLGSVSS